MLNEVRNVDTFSWIVASSSQSNYTGVKKKVFPAQMSFEVAFSWLARTPGEIIFDPFTGSGTTLIAAKALGRKFIGFEYDPGTTNLARTRIKELTAIPIFSEQKELFERTTP